MSKIFLITTADERSWKIDENILFLGEWCKLFSRKHIWNDLNYKTLPYHWDDRRKYYEDYIYLSEVYQQYVNEIAQSLNAIHGINYSVRYWKIVIGPWLRFFIDAVYDRYSSIKSVIGTKLITSTLIMSSDIINWIPKDYNQFYKSFTTDQWNHMIYSEIIKIMDVLPYELIDQKNNPDYNFNKKNNYRIFSKLKNSMVNTYARILPDQFNSIFFTSSYFDLKNLIKLQLKLGQLPYLSGPVIEIKDIVVNKNLRKQLKLNLQKNEFGRILDLIIPMQIPKCYIEGFDQTIALVKKYYPKQVRSIYTANSYSHDDVFKVWAGYQVEKNKKLFIGQHGGNLGVCSWSQREDHQIEVSDKYFSWGWMDEKYDNIKPISASKLLKMKNKIDANISGDILSVLPSLPRYFYCSFSMPIAAQFLDCIDGQIELTKLLSAKSLKQYKIRLDSTDFGWDTLERFDNSGLIDNIDMKNIKLIDRIKESKLCVVPHNATVFLETFISNFPTILFWNPKYYEIRKSAQPYYDELHEVGILHYSAESAAETLNKISDDPMKWWTQDNIQSAKDQFCENYAYVSDNWLEEWSNELSSNNTEYYGEGKYPN